MKLLRSLAAGCLLILSGATHVQQARPLSLAFEENRGQAPSAARFLARGPGYNLALSAEGNRLALRHAGRRVTLTTKLLGANPTPAIRGEEEQAGKVHYLRAGQSLTNIPTYARVRYEQVYPGIDLVYYGNRRQLEYDFVVRPGADVNSIALQFEGSDGIDVDANGDLVLDVNQSRVVQHKPIAYQEHLGIRKNIESRYRIISPGTVAFDLAAYDRAATLIIDPVLSYSTFLGGSNGDDDARAVATDSAGNVYITGSTTSTNFQTLGPIQATAGSADPEVGLSDAFVTKLNALGNALIYSTYLGGTSDDDSNSIAVDSAGNAVITGSTTSMSDFPTTAGAARRTCNAGANGSCLDAFVAKLNANGSALVYSTYLGGTADDEGRGAALDSTGNAYILGKTLSIDFPTTSGAFSTFVASGGFVSKLSPAGAIVYSTYVNAGTGTAEVKGIAVDSSGNAYITGATPSPSGPGPDVFIVKLNAGGTAAVYTQYLRGAREEIGNAVAVDASGNAYVAGRTSSINFPTTSGVIQPAFGGGPAFRTSDAGNNWNATSAGITRTSLQALAIAPGSPSTIYVGADDDDGGDVFKSVDGGTSWTTASNGLTDARVHALAVDPSRPSIVYAGTRTAGLFKSTNGGASWSAITLFGVFVTALAIDPVTPSTIYAGTDVSGVYKSTDDGASWRPMNDGLVTSAIHSILINPATPSTLYVTTAAGIYKSTDGAASWISATSGLLDPNVNAIVMDPRNPNLLYAATNSVGIFRSLNGGTFWIPSNAGLPSSSVLILVTALTIDPNTGMLYAAVTDSNASRVYKSSDGITWTPTAFGTARVSALAVDRGAANTVVAATVGGSDAFVAKWNSSGTLVYSTYLGGYRDDDANAIAVDTTGNVVVAGDTSSMNFPIANALQAAFAGGSDVVTDAFVTRLNASATSITWSTYLGGASNDFGRGVALDSSGNTYVVGQTGSPDFPTASGLTATQPGLLDAFVAKIAETTSISYSVAARGGFSSSSQGGSTNVSSGYVRIQPGTGSSTPSGLAIFGLRQNGVLVSEAAVPASSLITSGRIYAEIGGPVDTGIAIANPNAVPVTVSFYFTDGSGMNFGQASTVIGANGQIAKFLNQDPFNGGAQVSGTFTFTASAPVSVIALRGLTNERGEFLITTLPVADLSVAAGSDPILFPYYADGGGWLTDILLVNTTDSTLNGSLQFSGSATSSGPSPYTVQPRSSFQLARARLTSGIGSSTTTGSIRLTPATGTKTPVGVAVFSFKNAGVTVSDAGVQPVAPSSAFRMYAESAGSVQTGIAIANPSANAAPVTFELTTLSGASLGLTGSATVPANGQTSMFLNQIQGFSALPNPFRGVLRLSTSSAGGISVVGIRGRYNERGDFLITTTQAVDESRPAPATELFFPHFADGGGYTTQFILFNGSADQASAGSLRFFTQSGQPLSLTVR
jgi:hypothetical protein